MSEFDPIACTERLVRSPGALLEKIAISCNASLAQVIECLPAASWQRVPGSAFAAVLGDIAEWGEVTTLINNEDLIVEFTGPFPRGEIGGGFYNLDARAGLHGHLRHAHCAAIYFVRRPFMKQETASVLFTNTAGAIMFKIFVGRDADRSLRTDQLERFTALAAAHNTEGDEA